MVRASAVVPEVVSFQNSKTEKIRWQCVRIPGCELVRKSVIDAVLYHSTSPRQGLLTYPSRQLVLLVVRLGETLAGQFPIIFAVTTRSTVARTAYAATLLYCTVVTLRGQ